MFRKDQNSPKLRYYMLIGILIITALLAYGFNSYYMRVMAMIPFMGCVLYFDTKFSMISGILVAGENLIVTLFRQFVVQDYVNEQFMDNLTISVVIMVAMFVIWYLARVGKMFNDDSIGRAQYEADKQKSMMDDVLQIAEQIRTGTVDAMNIVNGIQKSSELVSSSVGDISESTSQTAENIQSQSIMTQSIQDNLEQTVARTESMVRVANRSSELNEESAKYMTF